MPMNLPVLARRWPPRWWRRAQVYARRANVFPWLEGVSVATFLTATFSTWLALSDQSRRGQLLPSALTTTLLVGTLLPAMAILMLIGRQREADTDGAET